MPYAAALPRGGAGLRNEKTFLSFAEAFGDSAKLFCGRLRLPALCGARLFRPEARRGTSRIRRGARAWENASFGRGAAGKSQKGLPARDGRRHFCRRPQRRFCARFGRLRLLAGKHVCVPTAPLGCRRGKPAKRDFPPVRGPLRDGCGRLTEVYGIRAPAADMVCGAL